MKQGFVITDPGLDPDDLVNAWLLVKLQQQGLISVINHLEISVEDLRVLKGYAQKTLSLDQSIHTDDDETPLINFVESTCLTGETPDELAEIAALRTEIEAAFQAITPQQQQIIQLRYGLEDGQIQSFAAIGRELNLSRERVRQIESKAIQKLKRQKALKHWLRSY